MFLNSKDKQQQSKNSSCTHMKYRHYLNYCCRLYFLSVSQSLSKGLRKLLCMSMLLPSALKGFSSVLKLLEYKKVNRILHLDKLSWCLRLALFELFFHKAW
jgi:hypothetical protein